MEWYLGCFKKYADFSGRARRKEYWMFTLFNVIATVLIFIIGLLIQFQWLSVIYCLAVLVPSLAVIVRRLHDIGKSGGWFFISFVPFVGGIILLVFECMDSQPGENAYGPNPKGV